MDKTIKILHLYPRDMNIYGDRGNILALQRRLEWHGYKPIIEDYNPGDKFPEEVDLIVGGGGQDSGQLRVQEDLQQIGKKLRKLADDGVPMLMICGLYQLFGRRFVTQEGEEIKGIGIFKAETLAKSERLVGNIVIDSPYGRLVGYENHSGQTFLEDKTRALGNVIKGAGNNGQDGTEGEIYKSVFGSYMHGSLLPKNPKLTDELIKRAVIKKYGTFTPRWIDDTTTNLAREVAKKRPR